MGAPVGAGLADASAWRGLMLGAVSQDGGDRCGGVRPLSRLCFRQALPRRSRMRHRRSVLAAVETDSAASASGTPASIIRRAPHKRAPRPSSSLASLVASFAFVPFVRGARRRPIACSSLTIAARPSVARRDASSCVVSDRTWASRRSLSSCRAAVSSFLRGRPPTFGSNSSIIAPAAGLALVAPASRPADRRHARSAEPAFRAGETAPRAPAVDDAEGGASWIDEDRVGAEEQAVAFEGEQDDGQGSRARSAFDVDAGWRGRAMSWDRKLTGESAPWESHEASTSGHHRA